MIVFAFVRPVPAGRDPRVAEVWRTEVLAAHAIYAPIAGALALLLWATRSARPRGALKHAPVVASALYLVLGAGLASIDQRVTSAITPYANVAIAFAVLVRIPPLAVMTSQVLGFGLFAAGQVDAQADAAIRLSNMVNGLSIAAVA
ncbi:MAG: hypothetical protein WCJ30_26235, partial [Deltaproteobacteria bacterium]